MKWFWRVVFTLDIILALLLLICFFVPGGDKFCIDAIYSVLQKGGL